MASRVRLSVLLACLTLVHVSSGDRLTQLEQIVAELSKQVQLQQFAFEEQTRGNGGSGLKQQRSTIIGSRPYFTETHTGFKIARLHDHANHKNTVGLGESVYVLNGVEFRTRHNDYPVYMAHRTSKVYNTVEQVPFPDVPPEVSKKSTVPEQIEEMKQWFKAWKDQDPSVRDYRKYFKPVLCYMEGGWHVADNKLEEAFFSDRHFIDALTWEELTKKVRFNAHTGRKSIEENYAYLPKKIINVTETGTPLYAQWNYRILCHPLKDDFPFKYLVQEDDLQARKVFKKSLEEFKDMRGARFRIEGPKERTASFVLLDELMQEIPGRDNYPGYLTESSLGETFFDVGMGNATLLNVARYHRSFRSDKKDASGKISGKLGFSDPNLFVAETTQDHIAPMYVRMCNHKGPKVCYETTKRVTYAIPLEIIYLTPLHKWNPYNIQHFTEIGNKKFTDSGQRNGGLTPSTAYKGTSSSQFYITPTEFFTSGQVKEVGPADTAAAFVGVLDANGTVRKVSATGFRIFLPEIEGVGTLRTRWPIMPIHGEASPVWKELNALKDVVLHLKSNQKYLIEPLPTASPPKKEKTLSAVLMSSTLPDSTSPDMHTHIVTLTAEQRTTLLYGKGNVQVTSEMSAGQTHDLLLGYKEGKFVILKIDGQDPDPKMGHLAPLRWEKIIYSDGSITARSDK